MRKLYVDSETTGLCGPIKLIQFSVDRQPVQFIRFYKGYAIPTEGEVGAFKELIGYLGDPDTLFVGWNSSFDLWHLYRTYHVWLNGSYGKEGEGLVEPFKCKVLDLYIHAMLSGPFKAFAFANRAGSRATAVVRRVPRVAQSHVESAVRSRLGPLVPGDIAVSEHEVKGKADLVTLSFNTSIKRLGLKAHAEHWGHPVIQLQDVWPLPQFDEKPWMAWPGEEYGPIEEACDKVLDDTDGSFYTYAENDIKYLWLAEDKLGSPQPTARDTATHIVAYTRYHGFTVDQSVLDRTVEHYDSEMIRLEAELSGVNLKSHHSKVAALKALNPIICSAKKSVLEQMAKGTDKAAELARKMVLYGPAKQKADQAHKVKEAGGLFSSLRVLGTATGRMAGEGSFNVQGIGKPETTAAGVVVGLRGCVLTAAVGDFHQFELAIAAAAWGDKQLLADLSAGIDVHLATAVDCHPKLVGKLDYAEAKRAKKDDKHPLHELVNKCRTECKRMVFGVLYGCTAQKIMEVFNVNEEEATRILLAFYKRYPGIAEFKSRTERQFCTADTVQWTADSVAKMRDSEVDLTGYTRHWTFEKAVACIMWELGQHWPATGIRGTVVRQDAKGEQSIDNACRSAFLGSAIAVQQAVYRQAANMKIQTTGSCLHIELGAELWDRFRVPMIGVHDEWLFARCPWFDFKAVNEHQLDFCERKRGLIPNIRFDLSECKFWSEKE